MFANCFQLPTRHVTVNPSLLQLTIFLENNQKQVMAGGAHYYIWEQLLELFSPASALLVATTTNYALFTCPADQI